MYTVLIADDEKEILTLLEDILRREGYEVLKARSGQGVLATVEQRVPDLLILDILLSDMNGVALCRSLRKLSQTAKTPIIFLTGGSSSPETVAEALNAGGDDYVRKPFDRSELAARIRAQLRRVRVQRDVTLPLLELFPAQRDANLNGRPLQLTRVEYNLLECFCDAEDQWLTTDDLLNKVWKYPGGVGDAALVRNHIRNLRRKLEENPARPAVLVSRNRRGYALRARVTRLETTPGQAV